MRETRLLRRQCRRELRELGVRLPVDVHDMARRLEARRGRAIRLIAAPLPVDGPSGYWIPAQATDFIWYQQATTASRQRLIVVHEFWHMIDGHEHCAADIPDGLAALMSTVSPELVRKMLGRSGFDARVEWRAETAASIINRWSVAVERSGPLDPSRFEDEGWVDAALGDRRGRL